jgi:hypothetical protein
MEWKFLTFFFAALNALYSSIWDIFMDFSLGQMDSKHKFLRAELSYRSPWPYYAIIIVDPIMRMGWVLYAAYWDQVEQSAKISFIVALIELVRRFLWAFFRVENEHATNVARFRASRDLQLPYEGAAATTLEESGIAESTSVEPTTTEPPSEQPSATSDLSGAKNRLAKATPVLVAVSMALRRAHTADFERRRLDSEQHGEDDEDDEDDDLMDGDQNGSDPSTWDQSPALEEAEESLIEASRTNAII